MQVAPGRRVGQGLKVLVRWASAAPLVSYRWLAIWWLSLKAPHPLYPRDYEGEGAVSAPERLSGAPLVSCHMVAIWWFLCGRLGCLRGLSQARRGQVTKLSPTR